MAARASIVGAAATHVGKVREKNEDAHFFDADAGVFLVCDGMGGHAAGEVASALAVRTIRSRWSDLETENLADAWLETGTPDAKKQLLGAIRAGVLAAHEVIISEAANDDSKKGMGTTLVGAMVVGNELVFAHAGDSRAYIVRDAIAMQLTEDHTLLARLLAAGIEVDVSGDGSRFRSMLTNALGIGQECKVSTFVVPLADGDRFLFCSDGISEYVHEAEIGEVLTKQPSPARAAQRLIDLALERGGGDNATTIVVRVLEAGEGPDFAEQLKRDNLVIAACPVWGKRCTPQQRLRALRIAISRDYAPGERLPAHTLGDRVAWIVVDGELVQDGLSILPSALVYPESLVRDSQPPDREGLAVVTRDVRALALRADDFRELCDEDSELAEALLEALVALIANRPPRRSRPPDSDSEEPTMVAGPPVVPQFVESVESSEPAESAESVESAESSEPTLIPASNQIGNELDARFDEMSEPTTESRMPALRPPPSAERIPLTLRAPIAQGGPHGQLATMVTIMIPPLLPRPEPSPAEIAISVVRPSLPRPPSEPDIETCIELEADAPSDAELAGGHEMAMIANVEDEPTRVTETPEDIGSQTLTEAVIVVADDEPTAIRQPIPLEPHHGKRVNDGLDE